MIAASAPDAVATAAARLDVWLETLHAPNGYGGPVVHWWRHCLRFAGPALDWRCEGIILGYLALYGRTREPFWLTRARRAGEDLIAGQDRNGNYRHSGFEQNPCTGGTPHEAACDLALLRLAAVLDAGSDHEAAGAFAAAAEANLRRFYIGRLWRAAGFFSDSLIDDSFVPNKTATLVEALVALAERTGDAALLDVYVRPSLDWLLAQQLREPGSPLDGGIHQSSVAGRSVPRFFPLYVARCLPALLEGARLSGDERYLDAALAAGRFLLRWRDVDGWFPQLVYSDRSVQPYPRWIAGAADVFRALDGLRPFGLNFDTAGAAELLISRQQANGSFPTADGFGRLLGRRQQGLPDFRDILPVCGWNDKVLRFLATLAPDGTQAEPAAGTKPLALDCSIDGERALYGEDATTVRLECRGRESYRWDKGSPWATISDRRLLWR